MGKKFAVIPGLYMEKKVRKWVKSIKFRVSEMAGAVLHR